ncbi:hypothetical protein H4219_003916 [Mycoemilia scoparia]|uniref:Uncharacterized protein n=1 Tax=Mycoemilia scoparia TaxID=417184 RepID=A0A9W8DNL9_9FUNG|nr:hypothetical protein H4219_003916 [Mycoemilia scoparia]
MSILGRFRRRKTNSKKTGDSTGKSSTRGVKRKVNVEVVIQNESNIQKKKRKQMCDKSKPEQEPALKKQVLVHEAKDKTSEIETINLISDSDDSDNAKKAELALPE